MSLAFSLPARTASKKQSIWRDPSESVMRQHIVALERASGEMPNDPKVHSLQLWQKRHPQSHGPKHTLPIEIEQRIADDIAFVAASEDDVKAVSAVGVEERADQSGLVVRLAVNDRAPPKTAETLRTIFDELGPCADRKVSRAQCSQKTFSNVMILCQGRIHGRLQSTHWERPKHLQGKAKKPLHQSLKRLVLRVQTIPRAVGLRDESLLQALRNLSDTYQAIHEYHDDDDRLRELLEDAVQRSHIITTRDGTCTLEETVSSYGFAPSELCRDKTIRQVYKIGRYWGLCIELPKYARKYPAVFQHIDLELMPSYQPTLSNIFFKSKKASVECYVHAEIQLLVHYDLHPDPRVLPPRVLGVSKAACYLCNLFILQHKRFFHSKTHGRLYDQWTMPDLATFSVQQRNDYRRVLNVMDKTIQSATRNQPKIRRAEPGQSWLNLLTLQASPTGSDARTIVSETSCAPNTPRANSASTRVAVPERAPKSPLHDLGQSLPSLPHPSEANSTPHSAEILPLPSPPPTPDQAPPPSNPPSVSLTASPTSPIFVIADTNRPLQNPFNRHALKALQPIHLAIHGFSVTIEIKQPASGYVKVLEPENSKLEETCDVDVDAMSPEETLLLVNAEGASNMLLVLRRRDGRSVCLRLTWAS